MSGDIQLVLLAVLVLSCWLGCVGMLRMKTPTQALHYLALPTTIGSVVLPFAMFCASGWSVATLKAVLITLFLTATNSVVVHATARAFRVRSAGHWEPHHQDPVEFLRPEDGK